ncbi:MAG: hypothetical protein UZ11_BCD004001875 [Bacteroidetes bacterium OLB11]|nr:MAG: hypothetical protein UZ11_BCD004001875 [Bacteroidetes bacterium OLB11]
MMDINEQVMELEFGDKNPIQLQKIKNEIAQKEQELKAPLAAYFEQEELMIDENGLENLKEFYFKKKIFTKDFG